MKLSFVIPALNEVTYIWRTLGSIRNVVPDGLDWEAIVCDHGSGDGTQEIARGAGARVIEHRAGTIGALRNRGAAEATGDVLVFLDADVELTDAWGVRIADALAELEADPHRVTGSHVMPPPNGSWLERHWFANLVESEASAHVGSAHLIIARSYFEALGGFNERLETGEDYEMCARAVERGSELVNDRRLRVLHHDFPRTLLEFVRREFWHGRGGFASWAMIRRSPTALATIGFSALHLAAALAVVKRSPWAIIPVAGIAGLCVASSAHRFRHTPLTSIAINGVVFYFYYFGRSLALTRVVVEVLASEINSPEQEDD